jgi:hypothetical protein
MVGKVESLGTLHLDAGAGQPGPYCGGRKRRQVLCCESQGRDPGDVGPGSRGVGKLTVRPTTPVARFGEDTTCIGGLKPSTPWGVPSGSYRRCFAGSFFLCFF